MKALHCAILLVLGGVLCEAGLHQFAVGKNKPAQLSSSIYAEAHPEWANNDQRAGPTVYGAFVTEKLDPLPWWMLDMQQVYNIIAAMVWNRITFSARFTQISLGVTSDPTVWTNFSTDPFDLCMYWPGLPTPEENPINFTCPRPIAGRYLAVYKNITGLAPDDRYLHFYEIDIFAFTKVLPLLAVENPPPSFSPNASSLIFTDGDSAVKCSEAACVLRCSVLPNCLYAMVRVDGPSCSLFGSYRIPDSFISEFNNSGDRFLAVYGSD